MLDEYRIEPMTVGQYLEAVDNEDIKIDQAVQREFCWSREMMNSLIYSALSRRIYIPNIILAEEKKENGTKQTYVVDAGQRTETLYQFRYEGYRVTSALRNYIIPYNRKKLDKDGNYKRDEYGNIQYELVEYDIRRKTYDELPDELKSKLNGCPLSTTIYQDCTREEAAELVLLYNNHLAMNVSQKSLTYIGRYADEIKRIKDTSGFLKNCTALTENERKKGVWERVISECVMSVNHMDNWKKTPKAMCDFLNKNSHMEEYTNLEQYYNRLMAYSDKIKNKDVANLFTSKNLFIWVKLFDIFSKYNMPDEKFGDFLNVFIKEAQYTEIDGENWHTIDENRNTKDKSVIMKKVSYLEKLMGNYFHINGDVNNI